MINATLDNERSLKQNLILHLFVPVFQAIRKRKKYFKLKLIPNQHLFHARFSIKDGESGIC